MEAELLKKIEDLYKGRFGDITRNNQFLVANGIFSRSDILDCLECELKSAKEVKNFAIDKIQDTEVRKILVLGPGSGRMGSELRAKWPKSILYEVDINKKVIERLKQKHRLDILRKPVVGSIDEIPSEIKDVDLVVAYGVLRYVKKRKEALMEINRVLSKPGMAIIGEGKMGNLIGEIRELAVDLKIENESFEIKGVDLPRLTYFYWLLDLYEKQDKEVGGLVEAYLKLEKGKNIVESIFNMASSSKDSIYGFYWQKND